MESRLTNVHTRNGHPVSLITDKKRQEPTRSVKKENTPTRRGIYRQERKIYQQERKIYQEEEKITIRTIIIDISINKYIFIY